MREKLSEVCQPFPVLSQALNNTNVTSAPYLALKKWRRGLWLLIVKAMAATKTATLALYEATDHLGTGTQAIAGATATITANTDVVEATVELAAVANTDVVTINDIAYTKAAATSAALRTFADAAGLVTCVNDATYGVPGVYASVNGTVVTLRALDPGEQLVTVAKTEKSGTITLATVWAQVEVDLRAASLSDGFSHVAAKVTTTANANVSVFAARYNRRGKSYSNAGASAAV